MTKHYKFEDISQTQLNRLQTDTVSFGLSQFSSYNEEEEELKENNNPQIMSDDWL